jgi:transcriptional regulator with XRE-family HTH domain
MKRKNVPVETARARFARNLKNRRLELELSQEELAHLAGLHRTYIGGVERGERNPTIDSMERLADAVRCDVIELLRP